SAQCEEWGTRWAKGTFAKTRKRRPQPFGQVSASSARSPTAAVPASVRDLGEQEVRDLGEPGRSRHNLYKTSTQSMQHTPRFMLYWR
ncbi:MAG: hypothetical protein DRP45_11550, partial [Candidatus Zixiibacteriota bacterium]